MQSEKINISQVKSNPNNPRTIKDDKFLKLVQSIKDFPEMLSLRPIVVNEDMVVLGGNMRLKACKEAGLKEVPVIKASDLTEDQQRQFIIKDNVGFGDWDWDALANEWDAEQLTEWGLDIPDFKVAAEAEEDDFDTTPPAVAKTVLGDLYELNEHRVHCADSTDSDAVGKLMNGKKADMVFTDPPYNVAVAGGTHDPRDKKNFGKGPKIENDNMSDADFKDFLLGAFNCVNLYTKAGATVYVAHADSEGINFRTAFVESGFLLKQCIIWAKQQFVFGRSDYHWQHEPILYGWKEGAGHAFYGPRNQTTVWNIDRPMRSEKEHPTQKPIALVAKAIENSSKSGDILYEPFTGGGSTLIACEQLSRTCYGQELDPKYCDVIVRRWVKYMKEQGKPYTVKRNGQDITHDDWLTGE